MDNQRRLEVFRAQVQNQRELKSAWTHISRTINEDLRSDRLTSARLQTKILALVYCSWSEATFSKLIHTPHGFSVNEIQQIKRVGSEEGVVEAWKKCIDLATRRVKSTNGNYVPNVRKKLRTLVSDYVQNPHLLRNKIAHGQWVVALNRKDSRINQDLCDQLSNLDVVRLEALRFALEGLCDIVENLIESPNKAFSRDYWIIIDSIEQGLARRSKFTLEAKIIALKEKKSRRSLGET